MATYYVGPGGSNGNNGTSWATRKLTLNGAEDIPVAANDTVYVGPGVYRESLTCDISGTSGNPITYIADVTGANTDGVGGIVRVTGSDNDTTSTRANCVNNTGNRNYRTFRGFSFDLFTTNGINGGSGTNTIVEDCSFQADTTGCFGASFGSASNAVTVRRCIFISHEGVNFSGTASDRTHVVQNCIFITADDCVSTTAQGGWTCKNCLFISGQDGVDITGTLPGGQTVTVNNCIFLAIGNNALEATTSGNLVSDYNCFASVQGANHSLVTPGANDQDFHPLMDLRPLMNGLVYPNNPGSPFQLSEWSPVARRTGTGTLTGDFYGTVRPTTESKKSWGPIQYRQVSRDTATTQGSSAASIKIADAGTHQVFVPTTNTSTTISIYCYREANYAGTNPRMVIKQPGQADRTTTDAGSASTWNQLTDTFTPAANPPYVVVEMQSLNTATSSSYATYFDTLEVS